MRRIIAVMLVCLLAFSQYATAIASSKATPEPDETQSEADSGDAENPDEDPIINEEDEEEEASDSTLTSYLFAQVTTKKGTLNMRKQPKSTAKVVAKLPNGSMVQVLEPGEKWSKVAYGAKSGYVMTEFLIDLKELPYPLLQNGDKNADVKTLKKRMYELGYLKHAQVTEKYDDDTEKAIRKFEILNGLPITGIASPELQAFMFWGKVTKSKSGSSATRTDEATGLTVSVFGWTSGYIPVQGTDEVEVTIHFVTQASGTEGPYTVTVRAADPRDESGTTRTVTGSFKVRWQRGLSAMYLTVVAEDAAGNKVTARLRVGIATLPTHSGATD